MQMHPKPTHGLRRSPAACEYISAPCQNTEVINVMLAARLLTYPCSLPEKSSKAAKMSLVNFSDEDMTSSCVGPTVQPTPSSL